MHTSGLLIFFALVGASLSWWTYFALNIPFWIPLGCIVIGSLLCIVLDPLRWPWLVLASGMGTFAGFILGAVVWPLEDPIGAAWVPHVAAVFAVAVICVGLFAGLIMRRQSVLSKTVRRPIWAAVVAWAAFGPVSVALAPILIPHNERLAAERVTALKDAVERAARAYGTSHISDGRALKPHYFGPAFNNSDWARIARNPVKKHGYSFIIYATENDGYTISAAPVRDHIGGVRRFCTDESGRQGCHVERNGSRHVCLPCPK